MAVTAVMPLMALPTAAPITVSLVISVTLIVAPPGQDLFGDPLTSFFL